MLVLAPTRELAQQSHDVLAEVGKLLSPVLESVCLYGGLDKRKQVQQIRRADIIVACPGRLLDHLGDGSCDLSQVSYLVLDEADRMLDMGFEPDIRKIISQVKQERQTAMFSATWPKSVQCLANDFLSSPVRIVVGSEKLAANGRVQQIVEVTNGEEERKRKLLGLLSKYHKKGKVLVFVLYKHEAPTLERLLNSRGYPCGSIHGNKTSPARAEALECFKQGKPSILVATDVAARGLDIPSVEFVINYSFPLTVEDYVHRIGRTGRAGATGISHTFFEKHDKNLCGALVGVLKQAKADIPEELLAFGIATKKKEPTIGRIDIAPKAANSGHITFADSSSEES
jgi:ATP-dependent RNA helicase DBP3